MDGSPWDRGLPSPLLMPIHHLLSPLLIFLAAFVWAQSEPHVTAASAIVIDAETGRVLWEREADEIRYPASTTKIMTALLMIERMDLDSIYVAPPEIEGVTGSSLYLKVGERLKGHDLLYAVMLRSANDGATMAAVHIAGSVEAFSQMMNERAREIGCTNTNFNNPHGLNDDLHTTTARDLALIAREAMRNPTFARLARTTDHTIWRPSNPLDTILRSRNAWVRHEPSADGIKTGYTHPAGRCFVGSATRDGFRVITVVLRSEDWLADTRELTEWAFAHYARSAVALAGDPIETPAGETFVPEETHFAVGDRWLGWRLEAVQRDEDDPTEATLVFTDRWGGEVRVAAREVWKPEIEEGGMGPMAWFILLSLGGGAYYLNRKSRRMTYGTRPRKSLR